MNTYIFHRTDEKNGSIFYPIQLESDSVIKDHVKCNPGTTKVERVNNDGSFTTIWDDVSGYKSNSTMEA